MQNWFFNEEWMELTKKNMEFTMDYFQKAMTTTEDKTKEGISNYFNHLNQSMNFITKNCEEAMKKNEEIAQVYKDNAENLMNQAKELVENIKNYKPE